MLIWTGYTVQNSFIYTCITYNYGSNWSYVFLPAWLWSSFKSFLFATSHSFLNFQIRPTKDVSCPAYGQCTSKEGGIQAKDGTRGWVKQLTMKWKKHSNLCWILIIYLYPILNSTINTMKVKIFDKDLEHNFLSWKIPGPNQEN